MNRPIETDEVHDYSGHMTVLQNLVIRINDLLSKNCYSDARELMKQAELALEKAHHNTLLIEADERLREQRRQAGASSGEPVGA